MNPLPCPKAGCAGHLEDDGFCDTCGDLATGPAAAPAVLSGAGRELGPAVTGSDTSDPIRLPPLTEVEPDQRVLPPGRRYLSENARRCGSCRHAVGRGQVGQPGLTEGFCPACGARYSFSPALEAGQSLGRYQIVGPLAHGGVGWVYLAKDQSLGDRRVVLKGLINSDDPQARQAAVREREALIRFDHPNIVRILDFVLAEGPGSTGYIVMEFAGGKTLEQIRAEATDLPVENVVLYGLHLLRALGYLHDKGYLYCDLKPDNVVHGSQVRLIDLGAVRAVDDRDSPTWGARDFQIGSEERLSRGLTVRSDLFAAGKTLKWLLEGSTDRLGPSSSIAEGVRSFEAVLARATEDEWRHRFGSAAEMAEQLMGVLRQIEALRGGERRLWPERSRSFASRALLLDSGLSVPPDLNRWATGVSPRAVLSEGVPMSDGRPGPGQVAVRLPAPLIDQGDQAAEVLAGVSTTDPDRLLDELRELPSTVETWLWRCRIHLARCVNQGRDDLGPARQALEQAHRRTEDMARRTSEAGESWRIPWHSGLVALVEADRTNDISVARRCFERVRRMMPGELAPMLALGYCAESDGSPDRAASLYSTLAATDPGEVSAVFGLVRIRLAERDRDRAVRALDDGIPPFSGYFDLARTAAVQVRVGRFTRADDPARPDAARPVSDPAPADLLDAARRVGELDEEDPARTRLIALVQQAALARLAAGETLPDRDGTAGKVLGDPIRVRELRRRLSDSFRSLAGQSHDRERRGALTDLANGVRPTTLY